MRDIDFQKEVLQRLGTLDAEIKGIKAELSSWKSQISERCDGRKEEHIQHKKDATELKKKIDWLEKMEQRRKGIVLVMGALLAASGTIGALLMRFFEHHK